jgi:hypothetical protein
MELLRENHGHAGPRFVEWLLENRGDWPKFRQRFEELRTELLEHAHKPVAMRLCELLAAICLAEELAHQALVLPTGTMVELCIEILQGIAETDRPAEALRYVHSWASAHQHQFFRGGSHQQPVPGAAFVGRWDGPNAEWIGFLTSCLEQVLPQGGYDFDGVVASWRDRGWLKLEIEANGTTRKRIRTQVGTNPNARVIAILRTAIESVDPPGPDTAEVETALTDEDQDEPVDDDGDTDDDADPEEDEPDEEDEPEPEEEPEEDSESDEYNEDDPADAEPGSEN